MQNGLYFGIRYFYTGLIFASLFWILLLLYSPYWQAHSDIVATFAFTTFLIPLFYLNYIIEAYQEKDALSKELSVVAKDAYHDSLTGLSNRNMFRRDLERLIKESVDNPGVFSVAILEIDFILLLSLFRYYYYAIT
jgi:predicted signal transduction protein with EAL and GGDEF domain